MQWNALSPVDTSDSSMAIWRWSLNCCWGWQIPLAHFVLLVRDVLALRNNDFWIQSPEWFSRCRWWTAPDILWKDELAPEMSCKDVVSLEQLGWAENSQALFCGWVMKSPNILYLVGTEWVQLSLLSFPAFTVRWSDPRVLFYVVWMLWSVTCWLGLYY